MEFESGFLTHNINEISASLEKFKNLSGSLRFPAESCYQYALNLRGILLQYGKKYAPDYSPRDLVPEIEDCDNIGVYCGRIKDAAAQILESAANRKNQAALLAKKLLEYISVNLTSLISLDSTAGEFGLSPGYISKLIKEETGESFVDYLNSHRLENALKLLEDSSLSVKEVAVKTGFNSPGYFIKRFRQRCGMTPNAWRLRKKLDR